MAEDTNRNLEESTDSSETGRSYGMNLFGRLDIFTTADEITEENVVSEVTSALQFHFENVLAEEYLYWYRRGYQPVLNRTKERNAFILNKVVTNIYDSFVTFANGYLLQEPAFYVSRKAGKKTKVDKLNEYLYRSGKPQADNILADWFHMVGKAVLYCEPYDDPDTPLKAYALDPKAAFVVYSLRPGKKPVFGVNVVIAGNKSLIDVYTNEKVFHLEGTAASEKVTPFRIYDTAPTALVSVEPNRLHHIPLIEYRYNSVNMAKPEAALSLLDAISDVESNRVDGISQFIQSIAVAVNCQFDEGVTADTIKKAGFIALSSIGDNKADFKLLTSELNQDQTQTLVNDLYDKALQICAVPSSVTNGRGTYDSTGAAAIFNNGWEQAAAAARNTEDLFKESNRYFDEILVDVLKRKGLLDIKLIDFELNFLRSETAGIQSKAQAAQTMLTMGMHPELAFKKSGLSNDPVSDVKLSEPYLRMVWGDPTAVKKAEEEDGGKGEAEIVEDDRIAEENSVGGV